MIKKPKYHTMRSISFSSIHRKQVLLISYYHNGYIAQIEMHLLNNKYKNLAI